MKLLWGTANLFSHRRFMAGAATNPDPELFAMAATQVKAAMEATHRLGGENYVLWGGREGYETLLNTDIGQELDQMGRFLNLVVEHKHRIGFRGTILIEPKPREPSKHQYDFDVATVFGFLKQYGLEQEVRVNIEANHATLAGHSFEHEIALAQALGIFGSLDVNRGDPQLGWDTDQFPNNVADLAQAFCSIFSRGGLGTGGLNFDAKVRRESTDLEDLFIAHIGGMDSFARGLEVAHALLNESPWEQWRSERYASFDSGAGKDFESGKLSLADLHALALTQGEPKQVSGKQERYENLLNQYLQR